MLLLFKIIQGQAAFDRRDPVHFSETNRRSRYSVLNKADLLTTSELALLTIQAGSFLPG